MSGKIITPEYIMNGLPDIYECQNCKKRSFSLIAECKTMKKIESSKDPYFIDSSFILYTKPQESKVQHGVYVQNHHQQKHELLEEVDVPHEEREHHRLHDEHPLHLLQQELDQPQQ